MSNLKSGYLLKNGVSIPKIGFGTWQTPEGEEAVNSVLEALEVGYRHIDTAAIYRNETSVGEAIRRSSIPREEIFVTSKLWNKCRGYDMTMSAFERTMGKLGLEYLDLYLIHWPAAAHQYENFADVNRESFRAMTELYRSGRIKAIGVSNFKPHHLEGLMGCDVVPMVNQIEYHPGYMQEDVVDYCKKHNIVVEAWSPLGSGRVLADGELLRIAKKYNKSTAQICIRWCLQNGILPLPKSVTPSRIKENADVFDFEISKEDMDFINSMPTIGYSGLDPDKVDF